MSYQISLGPLGYMKDQNWEGIIPLGHYMFQVI